MLEKYGVEKFDMEILVKLGVVGKNDLVKILGNGELKGKFEVVVYVFFKLAKVVIEVVGGFVIVVE